MQAYSWPFHTTKSGDGPRQSDGRSSTLSSVSLHNTSCLYDHSYPLWAARRVNVFRLFCFFLGPYSWSACNRRRTGQMLYISGRLGPISSILCLIVKICNIRISSWPNLLQLWRHWNTTHLIGLNIYLKSCYFFPSIKMHNSYCVVLFFCLNLDFSLYLNECRLDVF